MVVTDARCYLKTINVVKGQIYMCVMFCYSLRTVLSPSRTHSRFSSSPQHCSFLLPTTNTKKPVPDSNTHTSNIRSLNRISSFS